MKKSAQIKDLQNGDLFRMAYREGTVHDYTFKFIRLLHDGRKARIMVKNIRFEPYPLVDSDIRVLLVNI